MIMLDSFLKMSYQYENLTVYLCANISDRFFQHLSFVTFLSQSNEEHFNIKDFARVIKKKKR